MFGFIRQYTPSPIGWPEAHETGKNHNNLFQPNTCSQFSLGESANGDSNCSPFFSRNSIVVLLLNINSMWNLKKLVIKYEAAPVITHPKRIIARDKNPV
mmetsp:Transcript_26382/g.26289  ORF Transcript_26382/g.26289 Transcript_26382/m.26289 type:complete len:99 (-) Transcript_26382:144-440(-)